MKTYLVGGAVRDRLLGLPVKERDWVVVGAGAEDLLRLGYRQVGKDFPVFLHPDSHEEYALARTERKTAPGYHGFEVEAGRGVSLEQDLQRRDLTINAIAEDADGRLIDPWGGLADLDRRLLRHVSEAFAEDPVRILRVARFAARLQPLGFRVAEETRRLMRGMVDSGEVDALVPERVWQELARALREPSPSTFIRVLRDCGALAVIMPEVDALFGVPQTEQYHPEIDTGEHLLLALDLAARLGADDSVVFAVLCHDLGKALTPADELPAHRGHEARGEQPISAMCDRLRVPRQHRDLALLAGRFHLHAHRALELRPTRMVKLLGELDAWRRPERFEQFLLACEADARGRGGRAEAPYPQADHLRRALALTNTVDARAIAAGCEQRSRIPEMLHQARVAALKAGLGESLGAADTTTRL